MRNVTPRRFNKLVVIEQPTTVVDSTTNEAKAGFVDLCRAWASIEPTTGREQMNAHAVEAESTHKIGLAWNRTVGQISSRHRLRLDVADALIAPGDASSRYFNIVNISDVEERHRMLVLTCQEQTS